MNYQSQKKIDIIDRIESLEECLRLKKLNSYERRTESLKQTMVNWLAEDLVEYLDHLEIDVPDFVDYMNQTYEELK